MVLCFLREYFSADNLFCILLKRHINRGFKELNQRLEKLIRDQGLNDIINPCCIMSVIGVILFLLFYILLPVQSYSSHGGQFNPNHIAYSKTEHSLTVTPSLQNPTSNSNEGFHILPSVNFTGSTIENYLMILHGNKTNLDSNSKKSSSDVSDAYPYTALDLLLTYVSPQLLGFHLDEMMSGEDTKNQNQMRLIKSLQEHDFSFGFVVSPGRCGTTFFSTVLNETPEDEKKIQTDIYGFPKKCLVVHEDFTKEINLLIKPALYKNDTDYVMEKIKTIIIPNILIKMLTHKTLCYVDTGHQVVLGNYLQLLIKALGVHRTRVLHFSRDRIKNAASFSGDPMKKDPCSYTPASPNSLHYCPVTFPDTLIKVLPGLWHTFNNFQRFLWWVDEVEMRWKSFDRWLLTHIESFYNGTHFSIPNPLLRTNNNNKTYSSVLSTAIELNPLDYKAVITLEKHFDTVIPLSMTVDIMNFFGTALNAKEINRKINHHNSRANNEPELISYANIYSRYLNVTSFSV